MPSFHQVLPKEFNYNCYMLALGLAALPVLCAWGDWFPRVKSLAAKSGVYPLLVRLLAGGDWFQCALALFGVGGVAVPWLSGGDLGHLLGSLSCAVRDSACWWELMDDETSSLYIFLFMLLLILFLVIGLSIIPLYTFLTVDY